MAYNFYEPADQPIPVYQTAENQIWNPLPAERDEVKGNVKFAEKIGGTNMLTVSSSTGSDLVHIREYARYAPDGPLYPTKKGVHFTPGRWASFLLSIEEVDAVIQKFRNGDYKTELERHIGGGYFIRIQKKYRLVDIRRFIQSVEEEQPRATKCGTKLTFDEWDVLKHKIAAMHIAFDSWSQSVPCYMKSDHDDMEISERCMECNPFVKEKRLRPTLRNSTFFSAATY